MTCFRKPARAIQAIILTSAAACAEGPPTEPSAPLPASAVVPAPPIPIVGLFFGARQINIWPFTGRNFTDAADPINLAFVGKVKPLELRAALLSLDGNRSAFGFPPIAPFNCTWSDAIGDIQTAYSAEGGWAGNAVQLACGDYGPLRFHVRFFEAGEWTLGGAHFEVLIPGTAEHEVLSWELAERLLVADFHRTALLDPSFPMAPTTMITPVPSYRTINPFVYNALPLSLIALLGTPPAPVAAPVPIPNDGIATILNLAGSVPLQAGVQEQSFTIDYNQIVPRPFCATGPNDLIHVAGPVTLSQTVRLTESGEYSAASRIAGELEVTPVAPGATSRSARISRHTLALITNGGTQVEDRFGQILMPDMNQNRQSSRTLLRVGPGVTRYQANVRCD